MTASVEIITQEKSDIQVVPISSVTTKTEKDSLGIETIKQVVFIKEGDKAKMIEVETGISDFENIEIISGLKDGVDVIKGPYIAISQKLKDGTIIKNKKEDKNGRKSNSDEAIISVDL